MKDSNIMKEVVERTSNFTSGRRLSDSPARLLLNAGQDLVGSCIRFSLEVVIETTVRPSISRQRKAAYVNLENVLPSPTIMLLTAPARNLKIY